MKIDIERKWLSLYGYTPKEEGSWFFAWSAFRHKWEFGLSCDWWEDNRDMYKSRYYLYATRFNNEGLRADHYEFPRKNRWSHVTG